MLPSIKTIFKIGPGPSSSHTIGPYKASLKFEKILLASDFSIDYIKVTLYGSLALTGKGHKTDFIICEALNKYKVEIVFDIKTEVEHPNTLKFEAYTKDEKVLEKTFISIGGGEIIEKEQTLQESKGLYPFDSFSGLKEYLKQEEMSVRELVTKYEDESILAYLEQMYAQMVHSIKAGLNTNGEVAGNLHVKRVAYQIHEKALKAETELERQLLLITSYAYSVSEENAGGGMIVTAPTCGSAGVLPSVLYYFEHDLHIPHENIMNGLMLSGLIGLIIQHNATISGAVGGCQAEIGSACAMAAASLCYANSLSIYQAEYAGEIGMEHNLGLTCDPVGGYVAIPCIERNAIAALKSFDAYIFAKNIAPFRKNAVSLDEVIQVMYETGLSLSKDYKETSKGGLAHIHKAN